LPTGYRFELNNDGGIKKDTLYKELSSAVCLKLFRLLHCLSDYGRCSDYCVPKYFVQTIYYKVFLVRKQDFCCCDQYYTIIGGRIRKKKSLSKKKENKNTMSLLNICSTVWKYAFLRTRLNIFIVIIVCDKKLGARATGLRFIVFSYRNMVA